MRRLLLAASALLLIGGVAGSAHAGTPAGQSVRSAAASAEVPAGVSAGVAVFDRQTGTFTEQLNSSTRFRSASIVKLLFALDYLWDRGPDHTVPAADRAWLEPMLRSSNDDAANAYWSDHGGSAIITRMVSRLGLKDTAGPPTGYEGFWGYTALSARDTVTVYRYLLDSAPGPVRDFVMGNLRQSTRCASDKFDQHFGVAGAFSKPWAVKQGWSGSSFEKGTCGPVSTTATTETAGSAPAAAADVDLTRPALHSTGTVGTGDRSIVAVFTLHPVGTSYGKAYTDIGRLTRSLNVPGATRAAGWWYGTWSDHVNVRPNPNTANSPITQLPAGVEVLVGCQAKGEQVNVPPYSNEWWAYLPQYNGWISNIYISSPGNKMPDVKDC
ncbi:hypothetical protein [Streptomyces sp. S.PB5]|uniref:hypothetical protein n=1 Tax=Streptomyces sp. S.PB5 TaxID=3020844 RepID=UPI0025B1705B|nr:hypothetical protein [Streptomyces sp. S.PB5]MDN3027892.1 hypothetical protein [Streptomyces sp. S.PB5]